MKITYDLGNVGKAISMKLCLYIEEAPIGNKVPFKSYTIEKTTFGGVDSVKYTPRPFITMTIDDYDNEVRVTKSGPSPFITLNRISIFSLICGLRKFIIAYSELPIYQYYNGNLMLNSENSQKARTNIRLSNGSVVTIIPTIVNTSESPDSGKEAVEFVINNNPIFAIIDISELKYMLWKLENMDIDSITASILARYDNGGFKKIVTAADKEVENFENAVNDTGRNYMNMQNSIPIAKESRLPNF